MLLDVDWPTLLSFFFVVDVFTVGDSVDVDIFCTTTSLPEIYLVLSSLDLASSILEDVSSVDVGIVIDVNCADIVDNADIVVVNLCAALHSFM